MQAVTQGGVLIIEEEKMEGCAFFAQEDSQVELWHRRLGHPHAEALVQMAKEKLDSGLPSKPEAFIRLKDKTCESCVLSKQHRLPFPTSTRTSSGALDLLHVDLCGPLPENNRGGKRYFLTLIDDYFRASLVYFLTHKSQTGKLLKGAILLLENQFERKVKKIQSDRGTEFVNKEFLDFLGEKGIILQTTNPYSPEQNGVAERLYRTLMEKARALLQHAGLPKDLWADAVFTANHVRNRTLSSVHGRTPLEMLTGTKPTVAHLHVFGSTCFAHVPKEKRKKLEPVSVKGIFIGYEPDTKGYRVLRDSDGGVTVSKDVTFIETMGKNEAKLQTLNTENTEPPLSEEDQEETLQPEPSKKGTIPPKEPTTPATKAEAPLQQTNYSLRGAHERRANTLYPDTEWDNQTDGRANAAMQQTEGDDHQRAKPTEQDGARGLSRVSHLVSPDAGATPTGEASTEGSHNEQSGARDLSRVSHCVSPAAGATPTGEASSGGNSLEREPTTRAEALSRPDADLWQKAMDEKYQSLLEHKTWTVEESLQGVKPVPARWTFKIK
jgi:hypothetical protein